jgi:hypothetical protein
MEGTLDNGAQPAFVPEVPASYEEPHGELEEQIAAVWRDVLRRDKIGRNDNFFELGGNSLVGMDLTEALAHRLSIPVPILVLFQYPSVRELAEIITEAR